MVNATPTANTNLAGFGAICSPHGSLYPGTSTLASTKSAALLEGENRERCVSYFTLRTIIVLMETMKDFYSSTTILPSAAVATRRCDLRVSVCDIYHF